MGGKPKKSVTRSITKHRPKKVIVSYCCYTLSWVITETHHSNLMPSKEQSPKPNEEDVNATLAETMNDKDKEVDFRVELEKLRAEHLKLTEKHKSLCHVYKDKSDKLKTGHSIYFQGSERAVHTEVSL